MKRINTAPISGTQEFLPGVQAKFNQLKAGILAAYHAHGFLEIETPVIDRTEILLAKAGGDTEKQIYKVVKTAETAEEADQALRFDHTVPLARYTVEHANDLAFPFKATQVARNFRGERPQKGRFREFYQCDIDVIGWQSLPVDYDAEVILTLIDAMKVLPLERFAVRVSNRKILSGLLEDLQLSEKADEIFSIVDHAEKVPREKTVAAFDEVVGISEKSAKLLEFIDIAGECAEVIRKLRDFGVENDTFTTGVDELEKVLSEIEQSIKNNPKSSSGGQAAVRADMLIVRGLDYYTGTVFETAAPDFPEFGSICSGGRYENLASNYTDQALPGVGGSIGLTRIFAAFRDARLIQSDTEKPVDVCVLPLGESNFAAAEKFATALRASGKSVDLVLTTKKLGDKFSYANKIARYAAVIGEDEAKSGSCRLKNLENGSEEEYKLS